MVDWVWLLVEAGEQPLWLEPVGVHLRWALVVHVQVGTWQGLPMGAVSALGGVLA